MFEKERFIEDCRAALKDTNAHAAIRELVARAVNEPAQVLRALGEPTRAGVDTIYRADDLTILNLCWGPRMVFKPHDHRMWAAIGIYGGQEDNTFFRRTPEGVVRSGGKQLAERDVALLGDDTIHAVANPRSGLTGAIHIYGGDFVNQPRSQWGPGPVEERPYDIEDARRQFAEANAAWNAAR
jgi:predicted metal-dependent enzyme (double-stranded beta helix superfamily)